MHSAGVESAVDNLKIGKKNIRKRRRQSGLEYVNTRGVVVPEKVLKASTCTCPRKCRSKVPDEERSVIFNNFRSMGSRNMQAAFIAGHVVSCEKKRCIKQTQQTDSGRHRVRKRSFKYYLTLSDERRIEVCKKFFVDTLPVGRKTVEHVAKSAVGGMAKQDCRGKKPSNKKSNDIREHIRTHIRSFPTIESHYCRANSTKSYLEANLSLRQMYRLYCTKCHEEGIQPQNEKFYRSIFNNEFNIGFHHPKKDDCNFCTSFKNSSASEKATKHAEYNAHHARKERVRQLKKEHKALAITEDSHIRAVTFDLQQVLQSPSLSVSALYYKRKLSVYNQTVYNLANHNVDCFVWHEGTGGRGSSEMASCLFEFMKVLPETVDHLILYSDTCGGQNRNINFAAMCLHATVVLPISTIDHIYMESGHSQMECDSVHSAIEKAKRAIPIYSPTDYYTVIAGARHKQPYVVHPMAHTNFKDFSSITKNYFTNRSKTTTGETAAWLRMKWMQYRKQAPGTIAFKYNYDEPFQEMQVAGETRSRPTVRSRQPKKKKSMPSVLPPLSTGPIPISKAKYDDLQSLCSSLHIPADYHCFYGNLLHSVATESANTCTDSVTDCENETGGDM